MRPLVAILIAGAVLAGCGTDAERSAFTRNPKIGSGRRFQPAAGPGGALGGRCARRLGTRELAHLELFAAGTVILVPPGVGTRPPRRVAGASLRAARCYGPVVTLDPTGVLFVRPGTRLTLGELFTAWGRPLDRQRLLSFRAAPGRRVVVYVAGRRWAGDPRAVPLLRRAQIVVEVGRHVPPHRRYGFPPADVAARR